MSYFKNAASKCSSLSRVFMFCRSIGVTYSRKLSECDCDAIKLMI